jgi:two-component system CheB/CheR fusion protein
MARPEIAFELRNIISKVIKSKQRIRKSGIEMKVNSKLRIISLEAAPLAIEWHEPLILILFSEQEQIEIYVPDGNNKNNLSPERDRRIEKLEMELASAHADALALSQEQDAFTEELQSAHEEVVSSNEELQTLNEELETSKEEIESAIEELNDEQKTAIQLFYIDRKSYTEVSEIMAIPLKKVKSAIQNGKRNLKMKLEKNGSAQSA